VCYWQDSLRLEMIGLFSHSHFFFFPESRSAFHSERIAFVILGRRIGFVTFSGMGSFLILYLFFCSF